MISTQVTRLESTGRVVSFINQPLPSDNFLQLYLKVLHRDEKLCTALLIYAWTAPSLALKATAVAALARCVAEAMTEIPVMTAFAPSVPATEAVKAAAKGGISDSRDRRCMPPLRRPR